MPVRPLSAGTDPSVAEASSYTLLPSFLIDYAQCASEHISLELSYGTSRAVTVLAMVA